MAGAGELLTRTECTAIRGMAIVGIVLHNYCHFIDRIVKENEYQFLDYNNSRLWQELTHADTLLPVHLLSYFGHYGVPLFLFLSGYGLVRKYEGDTPPCRAGAFLRYNYLKLLRMLIVGFTLFLIVDAVTPGRFAFHWEHVVAQLLMVINVLPEPDKIIWPGIYWFFGLMMELYLAYRLLLYRRSSWIAVALMVVCWLPMALCNPEGDTLNRLRYNCIGGMLPFCMGIVAAREGVKVRKGEGEKVRKGEGERVRKMLCMAGGAACCVAAWVMCLNYQTWLWVPVMIVAGTIAFVKAMPQWMLKWLVWLGSFSAAMFVAHPIARKLTITVAWKQDIYDGLILYVIVVIGLSWAVGQVIDRIPKPKL